jgi:hypothetical protein
LFLSTLRCFWRVRLSFSGGRLLASRRSRWLNTGRVDPSAVTANSPATQSFFFRLPATQSNNVKRRAVEKHSRPPGGALDVSDTVNSRGTFLPPS